MIYGFNAGEIFKVALNIEENGRRFYEKAERIADDEAVKQVFAELGAEEVKHKARFQELMDKLPSDEKGANVFDPNNENDEYLRMMADMHVFGKPESVDAALDGVDNSVDALKLAIQFEKDSIVFFAEMQSMADDDQNRKDIGLLVQEEQAHMRRLSRQLKECKIV
jgi:rubrerythrin